MRFEGKEALEKEVFSLFPNFKKREMHNCNFALKKRAITLDAGLLSAKLIEKLQERENFTLKCNSEVSSLNWERSSGNVKSVSIMGKMG